MGGFRLGKRGRQSIGVTTTTVRTVQPSEEGYDPRPELDRLWADVANMEPGQALALAFKIRGISHVQLSKIVRGETRKIHRCTPGDPTPEEFENFVVARWKAGKYELAPVYKGFLLRRRSWVIGEEPEDAGGAGGPEVGMDVDTVMAAHLQRKSAMVTLREIAELEKKTGEDDDVKAAEMMAELLKMERERSTRLEDRLDRLMERINTPPPVAANPAPSLSWEALVPVVLGAAAKLPAPLMGRVLTRVMGVVAPAEKVTEPAGGWTPEAIMTVMQAAGPYLSQLGPVLQGFLGQFVKPPAGGNGGTVIEHAPQPVSTPAPPPTVAGPPPLSPEGKLALDVAVEFLRQEDYLSAWEALGSSQDTVGFLQGLNPDAKPQAYAPLWYAWLGDALFKQLQGSVMAFVQWSQTHKRELLAKEAEEDEDGDEAPDAE